MRGRHSPVHKLSEDDLNVIKEHIQSFPAVLGHYTRQESKRRYLSENLSISKLYDSYKSIQRDKGLNIVGRSTYYKIFCTSFNLSFHKPKKDQCSQCGRYRLLTDQTDKEEINQKTHLDKKDRARMEKANDKSLSKKDPNYRVITFDLQQVLYTPCTQVSDMYYSRKLCVYDVTVYELDTSTGYFLLVGRNECDARIG